MGSPEGSRVIEGYKNWNKLTLKLSLGFALFGAFFAPALIAPALTMAAIDGGQIILINKYQNKNKK